MKKFILYIISVLICALSFSGMGTVFADSSDDMSFAVNMGFVSPGQDPDAPVTRAELASVYCNIILGDDVQGSALENMESFTDVSYEDALGVNLVNSLGIMRGVGGGLFNPEGSVTYIQLLKSMICFLGYEDMAEASGGYPYGYLIQAVRLGIGNGNAPSPDAVVTYAKVASVLKLALNVNVRNVSEEVIIDDSKNYLQFYKDIEYRTGIVEGTDSVNVSNSEELKYYEVIVDGTEMVLTNNTITLNDMIGHSVRVYLRENAGKPEVIHYEVLDQNHTVEISAGNLIGISDGTISYYDDDDSEEKLKYKKSAYFVYNSSLAESVDASVINRLTSGTVDGSIKALDNNDDGTYDYIFINIYDTLVVDRVSDGMITNVYKPYIITELDKYAPEEMIIVNVYGERIKHTDIASGDIINVERDLAGSITKITVTVDKLTGKLEAAENSDGTVSAITLEGITYSVSNHFKHTEESKNLILGDTVTAYFNKDGQVARISAETEQEYKIGYLVDGKELAGLDGGFQFRIFTSDEKFEILTLCDKVYINDEDRLSAENAFAKAGFENGRIIRQPIRYALYRGKIAKIVYRDLSNDGTQKGMYMFAGFDGNTASPRYKASMMTFSGKLLVNGTTIMFKVPEDSNRDYDDGYYCGAASSFINDDDISKKYEAYGIEPDSPFAKIMVYKTAAKPTVKADTNMTVVEKLTTALNVESEEIYRIHGMNNGSAVVYEALKSEIGELSLVFGDVIRVYSEGNYVRKVDKVFDYKTRTLQTATNPSTTDFYSEGRFMYGRVKRLYSETALIEMYDKSSDSYTYEWYPVSGFKIMVCDEDSETISSATAADIYDEEHFGESLACDMIIHTRHGNPKTTVIYRWKE